MLDIVDEVVGDADADADADTPSKTPARPVPAKLITDLQTTTAHMHAMFQSQGATYRDTKAAIKRSIQTVKAIAIYCREYDLTVSTPPSSETARKYLGHIEETYNLSIKPYSNLKYLSSTDNGRKLVEYTTCYLTIAPTFHVDNKGKDEDDAELDNNLSKDNNALRLRVA
ncbi:unnamed protein product [Zymoseptoria tritici ST99CH_1A5]|uniref:Uncharacterized protein n=1 Tax=Zymoseptoria tritici ST99CH_1A5 TaxID=1276529 RepID=A0A1Y6M011_ZYMTR|nr:unnamed protein product [Zymoseptoria tritici ST99CH_1A5]